MAQRPGEHIHTHTDSSPAELTAKEARQGGRPVSTSILLGISLVILVLIGVALLGWFWSGSPGTPG